jgi:hypothetical protein
MKILGLLVLLLSTSLHADELKLHFLHSPLGVNWQTPWKLAFSTLKNQIAPVGKKRAYSISHVFVEVKCDSTGKHIFRGMTSAPGTEDRDLVFKAKYGLGTMFHSYKGVLEKDESIIKDLAPYEGHKRHAELAIKVSPQACERMLSYASEYESLGYGAMYSGLQADPLKREGSGCSAFGVSFMRVAGLMDNFTKEWIESIDIPTRFIGGPLTGKKVNILYILTHPGARWSDKEKHIHLDAWNPEKMHAWVGKMYKQVREGQYQGKWPANISRKGNTLSLELDMSDRPVPTGTFWL